MIPLTRLFLAIFVTMLFLAAACDSDDGGDGEVVIIDQYPGEWPTFGQNLARTGVNLAETRLTADNAADLVPMWKFETDGPVPASPVVATVDVAGVPTRLVFAGSYDGNVYALDAATGAEVWRYTVKPHPGVSYGLIASTASVAEIDGHARVFVAGGQTMYGLDAATGDELWQFDAGTGCTTCDEETERNEILSSPAVLPEDDLVLFGMDVNDRDPGKGGFYGVSASDGRLRWYFDLETGATCEPDDDDDIRRFDGFHTEEELGLPEGFLSDRDGCDFDRTETACGSVWSPVSVDREREKIFFTSSNCDTDDNPATAPPPPPMPLYDEALVVLNYDGTPAWTWRPREVDNADLAFGAAPNLFVVTIEGEEREVVGIGGKDGTYYLLDRDGENEDTGEIEPYWQRQVVEGGSIGGATGSPAVLGDGIFFGTAIGESVEEFQTPSAWALDASTGEVRWTSEDAPPFYGATSGIPGVLFMGGINASLHAYDAATGEQLLRTPLDHLGFSQAAIVDGVVYVGAGFGATEGATSNEEAMEQAANPGAIWAFCIRGTEGCTSAVE